MSSGERYPLGPVLRFLGACEGAVAWANPYGSDYERALSECADLDWIFWLIETLDEDGYFDHRQELVRAACGCARLSLGCVQGKGESSGALEIVEGWCLGEKTTEDVRLRGEMVFGIYWGGAVYHHNPLEMAANRAHKSVYMALRSAVSDNPFLETEMAANFSYSFLPCREDALEEVLGVVRRELGPVLLASFESYVREQIVGGGTGLAIHTDSV